MAKTIETLEQAIKGYGGVAKFERAFKLKPGELRKERWRERGVPRAHDLGLYIGLRARGYEPTPALWKLKDWSDVPGASP